MRNLDDALYFDNLKKEIKEKQNELLLSNNKVYVTAAVAMKQMLSNRDKEIEKLKEDLKRTETMHQFCLKREMVLSRKAMEMGYNPMINVLIEGFSTLKEDPLSDETIEIYNDPIWNN